MSARDLPEPVTLPCGCFIFCELEGGERIMKVTPCRITCPELTEIMRMVLEEGKPLMFGSPREVGP